MDDIWAALFARSLHNGVNPRNAHDGNLFVNLVRQTTKRKSAEETSAEEPSAEEPSAV